MNERKIIPVFFAVDDRYAAYLAVAVASLGANASNGNEYRIHVLINELNEENRIKLKNLERENLKIDFVNVNERLEIFGEKLSLRDYYSCATYYRIFIADMFPEYRKALYLDCDIVLTKDAAELYNTDLGENIVGAVTDEVVTDIPTFSRYSEIALGIDRNEYFNAGILLMDLEKMRDAKIEEAFSDLMRRFTFRVAQDQDYLNVLCNGAVKYLPLCWNKTAFPDSEKFGIPAIAHFKLNFKPWRYHGVAFEDLFWQYAVQTEYFEDLLCERKSYSKEEKERDVRQYEGLVKLAEEEIANAELFAEPLPSAYSLCVRSCGRY